MPAEKLNTHQKALNINLDGRYYGSFAEIGAGQEVVRWFFRVGGASGSVDWGAAGLNAGASLFFNDSNTLAGANDFRVAWSSSDVLHPAESTGPLVFDKCQSTRWPSQSK